MYSSVVAAGDNIVNSQYNNLRKDTFQLGSMVFYGGSSTPSGWLLCNGTAINRTTYSGLFSVVGTTFGVGDGSTTFNLPDFQDSFPIGVKTATYDLGDTGGSSTVVLSTGNLPAHTHTLTTDGAHTHTLECYTAGSGGSRILVYASKRTLGTVGESAVNDHTHGGATGNTGGNPPDSVDILPAYIALNFLILHGITADVAQYDDFLESQLNYARDESGLPGIITLFGDASLPSGWLLCDGSAISRTTYVDLFTIIGTTFGVGDGSTTFNLPDLSDRFTVGVSGSYVLGATDAGSKTLVSGNIPQHNHTVGADGYHQHRFPATDGVGGADTRMDNVTVSNTGETENLTSADGAHTHTAGSTGSGTAFTPLPKYLAMAYMIKY